VTFDGQETPLIVRQQKTFLAEFLEQRLDLGVLESNHFLLPLIDPAAQGGQEQLPGLQNEVHDSPGMDQGSSDSIPGKSYQIKWLR
jgi:hypothetical protein